MLTDSHAHLASHRFSADEVDQVVARAAAAGVTQIVTLATSLDDVAANLEIAGRHSGVHACIGIHPCEVQDAPDDAVDRLDKFAADPRVCAIGETGLDYYHPAPEGWGEDAYRQRQRDFLRRHFELAIRHGLNVVIHTRDRTGLGSFQDALGIYQEYAPQARAVFHCFAAGLEEAQQVIELGGLVSFGGVVTFKNADSVRATAVGCRDGSLMVETDAPYLAPEPMRGSRNEPAHVRHVAERLASLRGQSLEELAAATTATAEGFFRFRKGD